LRERVPHESHAAWKPSAKGTRPDYQRDLVFDINDFDETLPAVLRKY
jgi:hypothetical protein